MPGDPITIGPFVGGLANRADVTSIKDDQVVSAINWIHDIDGTLTARYPIWDTDNAPGSITQRLALGEFVTLYNDSGSRDILIGSNLSGTFALIDNAWDKISVNELRGACSYGNQHNKVFFPSDLNGSIGTGGWWNLGQTNVQKISNMPFGTMIITHKERLWIAGDSNYPSRLYYSGITPVGDVTDWHLPGDTPAGSAGFIDVNPGDGQYITRIESFQDTIVIFKNDSTWVLNYDGSISRGQLISVSTLIGAFNTNCVASYRDTIFVFHNGNVYGFDGQGYTQVNPDTRFVGDTSYTSLYVDPLVLNLMGDHLVLRHYNKIYVYNFYTGAWVEWQSDIVAGKFIQKPISLGDEGAKCFIASADPYDTKIYAINNFWDTIHSEAFTCTLITKTFDFGVNFKFKRLFWWAIDASSNLAVSGLASPILASASRTWAEAALGTWGDSLSHTWGDPRGISADITTDVDASSGIVRRIYKFLKGLRFRQMAFSVSMVSDGTSTNGPQRLFTITPMVSAKETVVAQVS